MVSVSRVRHQKAVDMPTLCRVLPLASTLIWPDNPRNYRVDKGGLAVEPCTVRRRVLPCWPARR